MVVEVGCLTAPLETTALDEWRRTLDASSATRTAGTRGPIQEELASARHRS